MSCSAWVQDLSRVLYIYILPASLLTHLQDRQNLYTMKRPDTIADYVIPSRGLLYWFTKISSKENRTFRVYIFILDNIQYFWSILVLYFWKKCEGGRLHQVPLCKCLRSWGWKRLSAVAWSQVYVCWVIYNSFERSSTNDQNEGPELSVL